MDVKAYIQKLTEDAADLLRGMVAIPSPSFKEEEVCSYISGWMTEKGIIHHRDGNNLIARLSDQQGINSSLKQSPTLMMCAHMDTVDPCEGYSFDPYRPENCPEDMIQGLGSNDDGASAVSMIAAFRYMMGGNLDSNEQIIGNADLDILLVLTCEEERSGTGGMTGLWPKIKDEVDFAIVGEPTQMKAAIAERGLLVIDAAAHGVSGHAARNEGVNALYIALEDIQKLKNHVFTRISSRMGEVKLNVTQINAGTAHNVIPDTCSFVVDIRPTEQYTNEEIFDELQALCSSTLKARNLRNRSSATKEGSPLQATAEALGIEMFSSPTTSDWMRIDCDAVKMGPGDSARSHRKDEFVYIDEIHKGIETYIEYINHLLKI